MASGPSGFWFVFCLTKEIKIQTETKKQNHRKTVWFFSYQSQRKETKSEYHKLIMRLINWVANYLKIMPKTMLKNDAKKWSKIDVKIWLINCPKWGSKNVVYNRFIIARHGGVQNDQKSINFDLGDPGPHFINFLKLCTFLQKRSRFRPPKSTP
jgi:hypothetical protein